MELRNENLLHYRALPLLGLPLAKDCPRDKRYEFMVVSATRNVDGGIASPPYAVAIK
jgi:hypothetical protein